ncbi:MAG: hypothetical protein P4L87_01735 [Formivibrio sp.]|nr:hypothetical protein [Formivibrio sp.]
MKRIIAMLLASVFILTGCETAPTAEEAADQSVKKVQQYASDSASGEIKNMRTKISTASATSSAVKSEPSSFTLSFTKMSAKLDSIALQQINQMLPKLKMAKHITITGYCDQKAIHNATRAALARANAVKTEIVKQGIDANLIKTETMIKEARHVALVESE